MTQQYRAIPLLEQHRTGYFSCSHEHLDRWLHRNALAEQNLGKSGTHVWADDEDIVVAYFTLLQTTIREGDGSFFSRIRPRGFPRNHEMPGILLGKLALDESLRGQQLGFDLLADAYFNACEAMTLIGGAVLVVDPMNAKVADFYSEFGFKSVEGSDRMVLNFREFNKGTLASLTEQPTGRPLDNYRSRPRVDRSGGGWGAVSRVSDVVAPHMRPDPGVDKLSPRRPHQPNVRQARITCLDVADQRVIPRPIIEVHVCVRGAHIFSHMRTFFSRIACSSTSASYSAVSFTGLVKGRAIGRWRGGAGPARAA